MLRAPPLRRLQVKRGIEELLHNYSNVSVSELATGLVLAHCPRGGDSAPLAASQPQSGWGGAKSKFPTTHIRCPIQTVS